MKDEGGTTKLNALIAQFPITLSIRENLAIILDILAQAKPGELVLFPEGAVSGYSHDLSFLEGVDLQEMTAALEQLNQQALERRIHLWVGTLFPDEGAWFNTAYGFTPDGGIQRYKKINLAHHERGIITPGNELPIFTLTTLNGPLKIGVQICREIRYPEQWGWLARQDAQVILHLNNAINNATQLPIWRSHLVSHAVSNQRFVLSANNAASEQVSPTIAIAPNGEILGEIISAQHRILRVELDLSQVSDWYLNQCRDDIVRISPSKK